MALYRPVDFLPHRRTARLIGHRNPSHLTFVFQDFGVQCEVRPSNCTNRRVGFPSPKIRITPTLGRGRKRVERSEAAPRLLMLASSPTRVQCSPIPLTGGDFMVCPQRDTARNAAVLDRSVRRINERFSIGCLETSLHSPVTQPVQLSPFGFHSAVRPGQQLRGTDQRIATRQ